jgi:hypothetical protein
VRLATRANSASACSLRARLFGVVERAPDGFEQVFLGDRLGEEVLGAGLDGTHARRNVGVTAQENDRQAVAQLRQAILELQA